MMTPYGVELAARRRKQGALTCFSSLVEEEAAQASQYAAMNRLELFYASKFIKRILDLHKADQSPTSELPKLEPQHFDDLHPQLQSALTNFSLV
ncbi:hypothetical protein GPALN_010317 [Globodera pallida]|nr:hypothetical protein GPALN_010317 [Globodera pallida]